MHGRRRGVTILSSCLGLGLACSDGGGRDSDSATPPTGAPTLSATSTVPGDTSSGTGSSGPAPETSSDPTTGPAAPATTTGVDSDGFPETSAVSWFTTGTGGDSDEPPPSCAMVLYATVRDFKADHPDFEYEIGTDPGIVLPTIGADQKPVYAGQAGNPTTTGQASFDQWYRDVAGVNVGSALEIPLADQGGGLFTYDNPAFFPIDGQGFGNEGNPHNYHFTLEIHTVFKYGGGEVFKFRGDDDLFVYVNGALAIDLGGVHGPLEGVADLDALAGQLGITKGGTYPLDFFFAERHTTESNFRIETTIQCLQPPG